MHEAVLLLGSNLGDRAGWLEQARQAIAREVGSVEQASACLETAPEGNFAEQEGATPFLNQALRVKTALAPEALLDALQRIERRLGRPEHAREYGPDGARNYRDRTLDIDILFYDDRVIDTPRLTIPHPRMHQRLFALEPLAEIAPDYCHPILRKNIMELLHNLKTQQI